MNTELIKIFNSLIDGNIIEIEENCGFVYITTDKDKQYSFYLNEIE